VSLLVYSVVILACILVGSGLRCSLGPEWWPTDPANPRPWMVEPDCYSQLARVQRILEGQGLVQNHFTVENWPEGLTPSTTATFDYVILALYAPLALFTRYPLDWAGALVSPVLWLGLLAFIILIRGRSFGLFGRAALVAGISLMPSLVWASAFGRPRHQSLIIGLLTMALILEYERWRKDAQRPWHIAAGIVWGLLCWTSLYEPLFIVLALGLFNLVARRRESAAFGISFGVVMLVALLVEGVHVFIPPPELRPVLERWLGYVSEMSGMGVTEFIVGLSLSAPGDNIFFWICGLLFLLALPWMAFYLWRAKELTDRFIIILAIILAAFMFSQHRWLPYAELAELFVVVRYMNLRPIHWSSWFIVVIFLINITRANQIAIIIVDALPRNQPSAEMALISDSIDKPGAILAPWWISPGLLYFSGHPIVSGSSHCGISGIEASARFFAATSWPAAERVLKERKAHWVVVWNEPRYVYSVLSSSQRILGEPQSTLADRRDADSTVAQMLIISRGVPADLQLCAVTQHLKLYEFLDDGQTPP